MAISQTSSPEEPGQVFIFGSQALNFNERAVYRLQSSLNEPNRQWLLDVFASLPEQSTQLSAALPFAFSDKNTAQLRALSEWSRTGTFAEDLFPLSNILLTPLVVAHQLTLYNQQVALPDHTGSSTKDLTHTSSQVLGLCTGLLSASAISCSHNRAQFQKYASTSIRLAVALGAIVDADNENGKWVSLSLGWHSPALKNEMLQILERYPEAYVSVISEENRVTVTTPSSVAKSLQSELRAKGLVAVEIALQGSFHTHRHAQAAESLIRFCDSTPLYQFPDADDIFMPTFSNITGEHTHRVSLSHEIIKSILLETSDWHRAFKTLHSKLSPGCKLYNFGPERCIPSWLNEQLSTGIVNVLELGLGSGSASKFASISGQAEYVYSDDAIAVVGMSCQLPGASDLEEFWSILCAAKSQHAQAPSDRFKFQTPWRDQSPKQTFYGNFLKDYDTFDHKFFKKSPREMSSTDPQHRLMLQAAYQAVEQSGYFNSPPPDMHIGCYIGVGLVDYENNVACYPATAYSATGNLKAFAAGKISHYFGWTGPGLTIDTACSSSAVAIHQACRAILTGECSAALAGGVNVMTSPQWFQNLAGASFLSETGQCKPFDANGDGYCRAEGVGAVFLKRYSSAVEQGDQILGVIAASSVHQNENCTAITVPNSQSLSGLFSSVLDRARLRPDQISYVEAHGTGTPVGDPAEYSGIRQALAGPKRDQALSFGSVKGLIGHTESASGIVALIKMILMINKGFIPPQASFKTLNPLIGAKPSDNMVISQSIQPWTGLRAALINNYGASGSNASLIVVQPPNRQDLSRKDISPKILDGAALTYPFWLSAQTEASLRQFCSRLLQQLKSGNTPQQTISNWSFQVTRQSNRSLDISCIFSSGSVQELEQSLEAVCEGQRKPAITQSSAAQKPVILCFGGQYSRFIGLDRDLFNRVTILRTHLDECDQICISLGLESIYPDIFQNTPIGDTVKLQTMLFALQYSCAKSWIDCGIQVSAVVGHSFGEITALCISGALSVRDTIKMTIARARVVHEFWGPEKGAMMVLEGDLESVSHLLAASHDQDSPYPPPTIACYNSPRTCTVAGTADAIEALRQNSGSGSSAHSNVRMKKVDVTNAFHCSLVDPLMERLHACADDLIFEPPHIHLERTVAENASAKLDREFVANHLRHPVYFSDAVKRLSRRFPNAVWLEGGSNSGVAAMVARTVSSMDSSSHFQPVNVTSSGSYNLLTDATMNLWRAGLNVQFWPHHSAQISQYTPIILPPYQFDRTKHWLELKEVPKVQGLPDIPRQAPAAPETLWSFLGYQDDRQCQALFRINTTSEKYRKRVLAHIIAGSVPVCASTFQLVMATDALFSLISPSEKSLLKPELLATTSHAPLCVDDSRQIFLSAARREGDLTWSWSISSTKGQDVSTGATLHVSGTISFLRVDDLSYQKRFSKYERFVTRKQYSDLVESGDSVELIQSSRTIYKSFSDIVEYKDDIYKGLKVLAGSLDASAGRVSKKHLGETWLDLGLADSFCQVAGIFLNVMTEKSDHEMYISDKIDEWIRSPSAPIDKQPDQWEIFARHHKPSNREYLSDVFAFDATTGQLVEVIIGIHYVKVPKAGLARSLTGLTNMTKGFKPVPYVPITSVPIFSGPKFEAPRLEITPLSATKPLDDSQPTKAPLPSAMQSNSKAQTNGTGTIAPKVRDLVCNLSGLEPDQVKSDSRLADLGIDSLMGMELAREVEVMFECTLDVNELVELTDFQSLVSFVSKTLGMANGNEGQDLPLTNGVDSHSDSTVANSEATLNGEALYGDHVNGDLNGVHAPPSTNGYTNGVSTPSSTKGLDKAVELPLPFVLDAFSVAKKATDEFITENCLADYVSKVLPRSTDLCIVHIVDALEQLGCPIRGAKPNQPLRHIEYLPKHKRFVQFLWGILEQGGLVNPKGNEFFRTARPVPQQSAENMCQELVQDHPEHAYDQKLTYYVGSKLADCLVGKIDGLQLIFGSPEGREIVSGMYGKSPINTAWIEQIKFFLTRLFQSLPGDGRPLKILEMGSGTGGTTAQIIPLLAGLGVPFTYTVTDLSPSLVAAARKRFKQYPFMEYRVLDIESAPPTELLHEHHLVLATNCVHATRNLLNSTSNIRQLLRSDGMVLMLEMTELLPWVDLIFGLVEGWWLFEDGRTHALASPQIWDSTMRKAGFKHVDWTDGDRPETSIQRIILGTVSGDDSVNAPLQSSLPLIADLSARQGLIDEFVDNYSRDFSISLSDGLNGQMVQTGRCVLVTGATGSLGSHLVAHLASLPSVDHVVCVNRHGSMEREKRQQQAFTSRGLHIDDTASSKIRVLETNTSKPMLGLQPEQYTALKQSVTDIVHNAWPMSITRPVGGFEAQFRVMRNLIDLARAAHSYRHNAIGFQFISSIATVGRYSQWSGLALVPEERMTLKSVLPTGYGDAKLVCERLLDETLHKYPGVFRPMVVRVGQIAGSVTSGYWNPVEHLAFIIKSSQTVNTLPDLHGHLSWCPVNHVAASLADLLLADGLPRPVYHIENPSRQPWRPMIRLLADALTIPHAHIVPFDAWLDRVRGFTGPADTNPAAPLVPFLRDDFERLSCGGLVLDTALARADSASLRAVEAVGQETVDLYIQAWKRSGFLA